MSDWHELIGDIGQNAGTAGTVTLPSGAALLTISVHASAGSATFTLFGGPAVPVINGASPLFLNFQHLLWLASGASTAAQIVFTNTDHYWVNWVVLHH